MQLATKSSSQFRHFLTSQQSAGSSSSSSSGSSGTRGLRQQGREEKKALFINCENTFRDFVFERKNVQAEGEFEPMISAGRVAALSGSNEDITGTSDLYLRLDMTSCLDGDGIRQTQHGR